jgi:hypothetical protein
MHDKRAGEDKKNEVKMYGKLVENRDKTEQEPEV